jgi:hypothetical protein
MKVARDAKIKTDNPTLASPIHINTYTKYISKSGLATFQSFSLYKFLEAYVLGMLAMMKALHLSFMFAVFTNSLI